jgi:hypothetical protein
MPVQCPSSDLEIDLNSDFTFDVKKFIAAPRFLDEFFRSFVWKSLVFLSAVEVILERLKGSGTKVKFQPSPPQSHHPSHYTVFESYLCEKGNSRWDFSAEILESLSTRYVFLPPG